MAKLLQESLGLDTAPALDRAHCSLQPEPARGQQPRAFIVKFHYYQEKLEVLRRAARVSPLTYNGDKIMIFSDLPPLVVKRRSAFREVKELLHRCQGVRFGVLCPARLKVSFSRGEKIFTDSAATRDYVMKNFLPDQDHTADS